MRSRVARWALDWDDPVSINIPEVAFRADVVPGSGTHHAGLRVIWRLR